MPIPRCAVGAVLPVVLLGVALLIGFAGLVARPGWLIVDGERPWVDEGGRPGTRGIGNDLTGLFLPRHLWQADQWRRYGRIPLWDPRGFAGRPNAGNPQSGIWYPPAWLGWSWGGAAAPGWLTVGHLLWAGIGAFALARSIGLGTAAATTSGAVLMLNPYMIAQVHEGHLPHVWSASWFPWAFLGAVLLRRGRREGWGVLSGSVALSLLAGHPQEGVYLLVALGGWTIVDAGRGAMGSWRWTGEGAGEGPVPRPLTAAGAPGEAVPRSRDVRPDWRRIMGGLPGDLHVKRSLRMAAAVAMALGLAGVEWLPIVAARPWVAGPLGGEGGGGEGPYHLWPSNLMQLISPRALGGPADYLGRGTFWETLLSIGWTPLVLVVLGMAAGTDRLGVRGWSLLLALSLVHAAGNALGLASVVGSLPGLEGVRVPSRSLFLAAVAASVLAGMGAEVISRGVARRAVQRYRLAVGLLALIVVVGCVWARMRGVGSGDFPVHTIDRWVLSCGHLSTDWLLLMSISSTGVLISWRSRRPAGGGWAAGAVGFIAIGELAASAMTALPVCPPGRFLGPDAVSEAIGRDSAPRWSRIRARDAFYSDLNAWRDGVEKTNLGDLFQIRHSAEIYRELYPIFDEPGPRIGRDLDRELAREALDRLGVARVVTDRRLRMEVGMVIASGDRGGVTFEIISNPGAMPRAYVVPRAIVVPEGATLEMLPKVDPRSAVLMPFEPMRVPEGPRQAFTAAEYVEVGPDRLVITVGTEAPGLLVVADTWMPGWSAALNGRQTRVFRGDHAFRVVALPGPGMHRVVMSYRAPGLAAGVLISVGSALVLIVAVARGHLADATERSDSSRSRGGDLSRAGE